MEKLSLKCILDVTYSSGISAKKFWWLSAFSFSYSLITHFLFISTMSTTQG